MAYRTRIRRVSGACLRVRVSDTWTLHKVAVSVLQSRTVMIRSINRPHILSIQHSIFKHSFHPFIFTFERETEFCTVRVRQPTKEVISYYWEIISSWETNCHFPRSTTARAIFFLRRLCPTQDLIYTQVPTDCFYSGFHANNSTSCYVHLFCSFYFTVLIPNNLKTNIVFCFFGFYINLANRTFCSVSAL